MRITSLMMSQQLLYNLNNIQENLSTTQNEIATGKVLNKPSDNPLAVSQDMADSTAISQAQSYVSNMQYGTTWMNSTSSVMQSMTSTLQSIRSVVLQALNTPGQTPNAITGLQQEVAQYINNIYQLSDTKQGNSYLFGGFATDKQVSQYMTTSQLTTNISATAASAALGLTSGGTLSIVGSQGSASVSVTTSETLTGIEAAINAVSSKTGVTATTQNGGAGVQLVLQPQDAGTAFGVSSRGITTSGGAAFTVTSSHNSPPAGYNQAINYAVSSTVTEQVNVTAANIFATAPATGTPDLRSTLQSILNDIGNTKALGQDLANLDANTSQLIQTSTEVGARVNQLKTMQTQTNQFITNLQNQQASLENANMAQVLTQYQNDMSTYQAALQMGAKTLLPTLAQYLP
ncbi:flagellar hook-associated protein FlgL [Alicyclobacillus mengziensis]|uniref:Flagellar hook-associated protein FlgL n=1 Tax=Alicyclobacillus mengziensis TaxID=2931921 RepID=A0A9X7VZZ6_9BACL|nr:flagellar hook-associated protein FlgL [Alicyclobacillus mengziensis]QSO48146.1 flagellar hook-associated protein FlgL [Alicyclobacillus mengziensis]